MDNTAFHCYIDQRFIPISIENIDDIINLDIHDNSGEWYISIEAAEPYVHGYTMGRHLACGGKLVFTGFDGNKYNMMLNDLCRGMQIWADEYIENPPITDTGAFLLDINKLDGYDVDFIIQLAIFGDVIF